MYVISVYLYLFASNNLLLPLLGENVLTLPLHQLFSSARTHFLQQKKEEKKTWLM